MMPTVPGPRGPIPFERDTLGYPTVHARTMSEATHALGYLHATDRLVQTELLRRVGEGRLMELLGDQPFARRVDRAVRALQLTRGLDTAVAAMDEGLRAHLEVYCQGFGAGASTRGRPLAMRALGMEPRPWTPRDVVLAMRVLAWFGMTSTTQLARMLVCQLASNGASRDALRMLVGEDIALIEPETLRGVQWGDEESLLGVPVLGGSNAFVIAGGRTRSGGALMLSEFHLEIGRIPPVTYAVDLRLDDGGYLVGMTAPGLPYILAGRNPLAGWTYTFGHADNIDARWHDCHLGRLSWGEQSLELRPRRETVRVRGRSDNLEWTFFDLPDGSVLMGDPVRGGRVASLRWRGGHASPADHSALLAAMTCRSVEELVEVHRCARILSTACLFGDREGHVGWMHNSRIAADRRVRQGGPVDPGVEESARPVVVDPKEGFVASANEAVPGWTAFAEPGYRKQRLVELLAEGDDWDLQRASAVTRDPLDLCATRMMAVWAEHLPDEPAARALIGWAQSQSSVAEPDADRYRRHFHTLHLEVCRALLTEAFSRPRARQILDELGQLLAFHGQLDEVLALQHPDLLDESGLADLVRIAWPRSLGEHGPAIGEVTFRDLFTEGRLPSALGLHVGPVQHPGSPTTLFQLRKISFLGHTMYGGPVFHLLMDLGEDGGMYDHAGGASEQWMGAGYGKGIEGWAKGLLVPIGPR